MAAISAAQPVPFTPDRHFREQLRPRFGQLELPLQLEADPFGEKTDWSTSAVGAPSPRIIPVEPLNFSDAPFDIIFPSPRYCALIQAERKALITESLNNRSIKIESPNNASPLVHTKVACLEKANSNIIPPTPPSAANMDEEPEREPERQVERDLKRGAERQLGREAERNKFTAGRPPSSSTTPSRPASAQSSPGPRSVIGQQTGYRQLAVELNGLRHIVRQMQAHQTALEESLAILTGHYNTLFNTVLSLRTSGEENLFSPPPVAAVWSLTTMPRESFTASRFGPVDRLAKYNSSWSTASSNPGAASQQQRSKWNRFRNQFRLWRGFSLSHLLMPT